MASRDSLPVQFLRKLCTVRFIDIGNEYERSALHSASLKSTTRMICTLHRPTHVHKPHQCHSRLGQVRNTRRYEKIELAASDYGCFALDIAGVELGITIDRSFISVGLHVVALGILWEK